jgi:predicted metal-binding protein
MNQLTTIASLPSGGGCRSAMTAEVGKTYVIGDFTPQEIAAAQAESTGIYAFEEGGLVRIGDVVPTPADKHGFEPFEYAERS